MSYMTWTGSTDPADKTGEAFIIVEGESLSLRLPDFKTAMRLDALMELAFQQGKHFGARTMRNYIEAGMDEAVRAGALYVTPSRGMETPAEPACECGAKLLPVKYEGGYLNEDQFMADRCGDWYCAACKPRRYYWNRDLQAASGVADVIGRRG